jgi:hypothetical protein
MWMFAILGNDHARRQVMLFGRLTTYSPLIFHILITSQSQICARIALIMHEYWLQKYIKEHYSQIGFTQLHGPYKTGADFKGVYAERPVKIEAEWDYSDYISHKHTLDFADILVVGTLAPVPQSLKEKLPSVIINLDHEQVIEWARPRVVKKGTEDYYSYPWRRFSRNLLHFYTYYQKQNHRKIDFIGSKLVLSMSKGQKPVDFRFEAGGKEESFEGRPEDKASWDYWLDVAHVVADNFRLKPALLRPNWIDRVAIYSSQTGRITDGELKRFKDVAAFIDDLILREPPTPS